MERSFLTRLLAALLTLAVLAVCLGCAPPSSYDRNDPKRQARQDELLRWMQTDHRN
jgi:hypothetical protein